MNGRLTALIEKLGLVVDDGSMPTELEALGCDLNDALWSARVLMDEPELIKRVHREYFEAGADIGMSASYQATIPGFMKRGRTLAEAEALISSSVTLLLEARREWWGAGREGRAYPLAAAAVGPYGAFLADGSEYRGNYGLADGELAEFHRRRMELLKEAGADCFAIETIPSLAEARVLAGLADELDLDCWVTFSCRNGFENCEGTPVRDCARELAKFKSVCAVGVNCTAPAFIESLIKEFRLEKVRKNKGDQLSGGERRRTEIARCLAIDPKFIMLDEPFAGVDPIAVEDIQHIVWQLKYRNIGILITDHNVQETLTITDRAYLLFEGKILFQGNPEELASNKIVREKYLSNSFVLRKKDFQLIDEQKRAQEAENVG